MAWEQLSITKPHLVYIILGGFTSLFMLCSSVIKERLYIGEATVATLCGIIFGPHAAGLINPLSWGNTDLITLEFSRIVLVVQCFAVGVELPKAYMERHWRSVVFLLVPVMTFGWLITSLFIWAVFHGSLDWLQSLTIAACVTATDPVLASSVVGKGKFAKRVPKHLRDLLSAESGCNDGMAFPFIYLALYLLKYRPNAGDVIFHWTCFTILYECIFGAFYGVVVGYIARRLIRYAHEQDLIDRESFLVFYFVLALFCAGSGSLLGLDDLLVGFAAGVGFSNDGWFTEKTEESHVSNVIDLLINLAFFVYFGTIIPWEQFNDGNLGMEVWKLVVIGLLVLFFRRIPIMMLLKPVIPDIKTWREALFAGHFGPIGVGAIFVAILARAELETETTTPLAGPIPESVPEYNIVYLIWPITTFLVICSIVVHGSSIAVFTLGKHINTLTLTMSYTQANEQVHWTDRLPRIQSRSKSSMSMQSVDEKSGNMPLVPGTFLRRQKEEDNPSRVQSRASSRHRSRHSKSRSWDVGIGPGGPVSRSAIQPARRTESPDGQDPQDPGGDSRSDSDTLAFTKSDPSFSKTPENEEQTDLEKVLNPGEIYEEGRHTIYEDEDGNVLGVERTSQDDQAMREEAERREGRRLMHEEGADRKGGVAPTHEDPDDDTGREARRKLEGGQDGTPSAERPGRSWREGWNKVSTMTGVRRRESVAKQEPKPEAEIKKARGPARAYQYGNTIIVEDEDGEVIKKYEIPAPDRKQSTAGDVERSKQHLKRMGTMLGLGSKDAKVEAGAPGPTSAAAESSAGGKNTGPRQASDDDNDDERVRFTISSGGRRMSKAEFIDQIRNMDQSSAPKGVKREARQEPLESALGNTRLQGRSIPVSHVPAVPEDPQAEGSTQRPTAELARTGSRATANNLKLVDSNQQEVPFHDISSELRRHGLHREEGETAAERRRRQALQAPAEEEDSEDDGTERVPPSRRIVQPTATSPRGRTITTADDQEETAAERRRREGALAGQSSASPSTRTTTQVRGRPGAASSVQGAAAGDGETAAERRRREGALGQSHEESDSEDDGAPRQPPQPRNIRFAEQQSREETQEERPRRVRWGQDRGR